MYDDHVKLMAPHGLAGIVLYKSLPQTRQNTAPANLSQPISYYDASIVSKTSAIRQQAKGAITKAFVDAVAHSRRPRIASCTMHGLYRER